MVNSNLTKDHADISSELPLVFTSFWKASFISVLSGLLINSYTVIKCTAIKLTLSPNCKLHGNFYPAAGFCFTTVWWLSHHNYQFPLQPLVKECQRFFFFLFESSTKLCHITAIWERTRKTMRVPCLLQLSALWLVYHRSRNVSFYPWLCSCWIPPIVRSFCRICAFRWAVCKPWVNLHFQQ